MSDSDGPVWAVWRQDRSYRVRFPARENAERWRAAREDIWDIEPMTADQARRGAGLLIQRADE